MLWWGPSVMLSLPPWHSPPPSILTLCAQTSLIITPTHPANLHPLTASQSYMWTPREREGERNRENTPSTHTSAHFLLTHAWNWVLWTTFAVHPSDKEWFSLVVDMHVNVPTAAPVFGSDTHTPLLQKPSDSLWKKTGCIFKKLALVVTLMCRLRSGGRLINSKVRVIFS